jgi:hypothetical protein
MVKIKDLYVSLESEKSTQDDAPAGPNAVWIWWAGGGAVGPVGDKAPCVQDIPGSNSGAQCETSALCFVVNTPNPGMAGAVAAAPMALREYLKSALEKNARETKAVDQVGELERLEHKLTEALEEVRARKAEIRERCERGESK